MGKIYMVGGMKGGTGKSIDHTDEEIQKAEAKMCGLGGSGMDGLPHGHDVNAGENRIINGIEEIDILKERYRQAKEYMAWFKPAWDNLSEDEQYVLEVFFMGGTASEDATRLAAGHFGIERTSVYMKKKRALDHLTVLLYGKC